MFLSMDNEHIIYASVGYEILINDIIEGDDVGNRFLFKPYMWLVTVYLYLVSDEHLASVNMKANIFLGIINVYNQLGIS